MRSFDDDDGGRWAQRWGEILGKKEGRGEMKCERSFAAFFFCKKSSSALVKMDAGGISDCGGSLW